MAHSSKPDLEKENAKQRMISKHELIIITEKKSMLHEFLIIGDEDFAQSFRTLEGFFQPLLKVSTTQFTHLECSRPSMLPTRDLDYPESD